MNCREVAIRLYEFVDRELSPEEVAQVQRHLEECPPCLQHFQLEVSVRRLVRRACCETAPESLKARILHQRF